MSKEVEPLGIRVTIVEPGGLSNRLRRLLHGIS
jgi:hypothetical protein